MTQFWSEFIPSPRWVRAQVGNTYIADSKRVMLLRQTGALPVYYFPTADVRHERLTAGPSNTDARHGKRQFWTLAKNGKTIARAAWSYPESAELSDYIAFKWEAIDAWYEEDDQIYCHARDPYHRIDVLNSSRHIRIEIEGVQVADTQRARLLFETGLPTRYYIPKADVNMALLAPSQHQSQCPYKGVASYYSILANGQRHENIVWYYPFPIPECPKIENLLCFYNEVVDIWLDGEKEVRPKTHFA